MDTTGPVHYTYYTPAGPVTIEARPDALTRVVLGRHALSGPYRPSALTNLAATQIQEYLVGRRGIFEIAYRAYGSSFQKKVWEALANVPYAHAITAGELAREIGHEGANRAVGVAVRANPLAIIVPDHRLVRADGGAWGDGKQARVRAALLKLERERAE